MILNEKELKEKLKPLIAKYNNLTKVQIEEMTEDETKSNFIDKVLFDILGWDPNLTRLNRSIITESNKKRPDYWYPLDPNIKIIVEAKRLGLDGDIEKGKYDKQVQEYAYHKAVNEPEAEKIRIRGEAIKSLLDTISQAPNGFEYRYEHIGVDLLGSIYENYLAYIQKGVELEGGKSERKRYGIYYTPKYIVDFITASVLKYRKKISEDLYDIKILDPSCGSGSFLISFIDRLNSFYKKMIKDYEEITPNKKLDYFKNNLFGVDIDRRAIQISKLNIYLELLTLSPGYKIDEKNAQLMPSLNENLKQGNSLVDVKEISEDYFDWANEFSFLSKNNGFDIIVGNPPWVSIKGKHKSIDLSEKQLKYLLDKYPADKYRPNLFEIFIWRSLSLLKENGLFSFVVPDRICYNEQFINLRKTILENYELKCLWFRPEFKGKISDDVIFVIKKTKPSNASKVEIAEYPSQDFIKIPQKVYSQVSDYSWFMVNKKALNILDAIRKNPEVKHLDELFKSNVGFIAKPNTVTEKKENAEQIKVLKGEDISKYIIKKYHYFRFSKENLIGGTSDIKKLGIKKKIFLRKTGNKLTAIFDTDGVYPEQSLYIIYFDSTNNKSEEDMKILCLLLNSTLLNFYYNNFGITNRDSTPQLKKIDLDKFPIIIPKDQQNRSILLSFFDELETLNKKSNYLQFRNQSRQDEINRKILKLTKQLDSVIFKIYGVNKFFE